MLFYLPQVMKAEGKLIPFVDEYYIRGRGLLKC